MTTLSATPLNKTPWAALRGADAVDPTSLLREGLRGLSRYHLDRSSPRFKLDQNEAPWELPDSVRDRIVARWRTESWSSYPDFYADELRAAIAAYHGWSAEGVVVGNGSNEVLAAALTAFAGPGQRVRGIAPSFGLYPSFVAKSGATYETIPLEADLELPMVALERAVERDPHTPVLLCSPNNPTGGVASFAAVERLLERLEAPLLLDAAYQEFAAVDYRPLLRRFRHLVLFGTFSKAWALAAGRLGYVLADPDVAAALLRVTLPYTLNRATAIAGVEALAQPSWVEEQVARLVEARAVWREALRARGLEVYPSQANFLLVRAGSRAVAQVAAAQALFDRWAGAGVLVRNVGSYPMLEGCLRIAIGTDAARDVLLDVLDQGGVPS